LLTRTGGLQDDAGAGGLAVRDASVQPSLETQTENSSPGALPLRRRPARSRRWLRVWTPAAALSLSAHLVLFVLLVSSPSPPTKILAPEPEPRALVVTLTRPPPPPPPPPAPVIDEPPPGPAQAAQAAAPSPAPPRPVPARAASRPRPVRTPPPPDVPTLPANPTPVVAPMAVIGEAQLAGALKAGTGQGTGPGAGGGGGSGSGASGGSCDMIRRLQDALRADPEVRAAVTRAHSAMPAAGRAILVWDGDWIQDPGQAGKGLAGVRQAIALEVAFAPRECRTQAMRGLAVIAFAEGPAAPRLALGEASWRWSDLLGAR
jgi:hypothetical protein